jgi:Carboxypeptidase regulatory-like domain/TonB-dependent Receptor Plug Domain
MRLQSLIAAVAMWLVMAPYAAAQARLTGADVEGTVLDQAGGVVVGATIAVTNVDTNIVRMATADPSGRFVVAALPPGRYSITVARSGFRTEKREDVTLSLGQSITIDFTLSIAPITETVEVTAGGSLLRVTQPTVSSLVGQQQIDALPSNGRNFISFSTITPGVSPDHTPQQGASTTSGLSFAGQRARSNNIMVDGFDNNDLFVGAVRATFSQEAIREFQVLPNSYSAEFGKASGGVVNIVSKSGTNTIRGNVYLYVRDETLNAKSYFERFDLFGNPVSFDKAPYAQKQWGATLGGPIKRDRTFFFLSQERTAITDNRVVTIDPTAATALNSLGFRVELGNVPLRVTNNEFLGKVDHHWSAVRSLVARMNYADIEREGIDDFGGSVARSRGTTQLRTDWAVAAAETDVLSERWLNELRTQFAHEDQAINALDPSCGGACVAPDQGGPTLEITGVASVGRQRFTPQLRLNRHVQLVDTLSYFRGRHHLKFGGEYNFISFPGSGNALPLHFGGRYIFSAIPALGVPSALAGLTQGIPAAYVQGYGNPYYVDMHYQDLSLFGQDEIKRARLTLHAGVRYQRQYWQDPTYSVSDVGGSTLSYRFPSDPNNVAARIALAYDVTGDARTAVHGSYGTFYDNVVTAVRDVGTLINGSQTGVRTLVLTAPRASIAWNAPGHRLSEAQAVALLGTSYPSVAIAPSPSLKNSFTHQVMGGVDRRVAPELTLSVNGVYVRGFNLVGTIDYNPVLPVRLGPARRPNDLPCSTNPAAACVNGGIPGTSASVLQYTTFGESWYKGVTLSLNKRFSHHHEFLLSYTLSKAEDLSTDFQSNFIVQNSGLGRNPADKFGLPLGFDPESERGPATHDQRHRLVLSGLYELPHAIRVSGILTAASGRPFTPLAGADLNGDGNGGTFPPDRARVNPADESTSVGRNSETTAGQFAVDVRVSKTIKIGGRVTLEAMLDVFNLFNRANFFEDTNQSSFAIFGTGAYPTDPLPTYGRYTLTLPPRQAQIAAKIAF